MGQAPPVRQYGSRAALQSRSAQDPHLLRCVFFWVAQFNFEHSVDHIPGRENTADRVAVLFSSFPQVRRHPTTLPSELVATNGPHAVLDITTLGAVQDFFKQGLAATTTRSYSSAKRKYIDFCQNLNISVFPISQKSACLFVAHLAKQGLRPQTISVYLSAFANRGRIGQPPQVRMASAQLCVMRDQEKQGKHPSQGAPPDHTGDHAAAESCVHSGPQRKKVRSQPILGCSMSCILWFPEDGRDDVKSRRTPDHSITCRCSH